ncbi:N-(5'-phosphoribosyl)anthranilate isomerase [Streptomyces rectiviolaceus]|uniref:N-(5'-phosphoribosyl)anthranilate isomerase n=1 Tax=Streptomyces rectiviolaceus TaxID=332591 RepID=A0ABP6MAW0_9ACTN
MWLKVCGLTRTSEIRLLSSSPVTTVGLWYGVPDGKADLTRDELTTLAGLALERGLEPVLVTLLDDPEQLRDAVRASGVRRVQLHGYTTPQQVAAVRAALPDVVLLKVLHVRRGKVLEKPFVTAFERAGTDLFLFDSVGDDGRIGSTGKPLDPAALAPVLDTVRIPFLLAGGLTADAAKEHGAALRHDGFLGIDVDSGARRPDGTIAPLIIDGIRHAWSGELRRRREELRHAVAVS